MSHRAAVDSRIALILDWISLASSPAGRAAEEIRDHLATASVGGKAFRADLLLATVTGFGAPVTEAVLDAAAALELFQTAALIHDDVLDGSDMRRGRPATHRAMASAHADRAGLGDADAYGRAGAILTGDIALVAAQHAATRAAVATDIRVADLFARMAVLVTAGQHLDMRVATEPLSATLETDVQAVMRSKTASYTAEYPLAMGAAIAGADDATVAAIGQAGLPLGIAFQLRDDLLGLTGSAAQTGKPVGDDLREGKRTMVVAHALSHGTPAQREAILAVLGDASAPSAAVDRAISAIADAGAIAAVEVDIAALAARARTDLTALIPAPQAVLALVDAASARDA